MGTATESKSAENFVDQTTLKEILGISDGEIDQAMGIAYQLYLTGRLDDAETVCKGLIACDHRFWWSHSLHASVLRRLGRSRDALAAVEEGLKYEPGQAKLTAIKADLLMTLAREAQKKATAQSAATNGQSPAPAPETVPPARPASTTN